VLERLQTATGPRVARGFSDYGTSAERLFEFRNCASLARQSKIARLRAIVRKQTPAVPPIYQITVRHRAKRYPTNLTNDKENIQ
jgi:hypothetical protein